MDFELTPNVRVKRDDQGIVRLLSHPQEPYTSPSGVKQSLRALSEAYVHDVAEIYGIDPTMLSSLAEPVERKLKKEPLRLRMLEEKRLLNSIVLGYQQTFLGLPIWESHLSVRLHQEPLRVTSSDSSLHGDVQCKAPPKTAKFMPSSGQVTELLQDIVRRADGKLVNITEQRLLIYRYNPDQRFDPEVGRKEQGAVFENDLPTLPLDNVPRTISPGSYYVVNEALFTTAIGYWKALHWRMMIEVNTGAIVYLRPLVSGAFGNIFGADPVTLGTGFTPCAPGTDLDPITDLVTLDGLTPPSAGDPQELTSEFVTLGEIAAPVILPPTAALPTGNFSFSAVTDDFGAVNCYHHCDGLFRMMEDMGFDIPTYFPDTTFPLTVDHREGSGVNAHGYGNAGGNGAGGMGFQFAQAGCPVGIGTDLRVVLHEFCHEILWEHVSSPNFGFAHSAGDALAAILLDPASDAPDSGMTFPWISILVDRRHDRDVTAGWAWDGTNDDTQYLSEQILSTLLFRLYVSTGGGSGDLGNRQFAARYVAYLIIKAIGLLTTTTTDPEVYATALMEADLGTTLFDGYAGGAIHKVVRWAFEKQGLYQPAGAPTPVASEGDPPEVDVYIDDGRAGEYDYIGNFWNTSAIWNRLAVGAGTEADHETPVVGVTNYLYVRVKNRGTQPALNVSVRAYHCVPATGLVWPDDWAPMTTAVINVVGSIASGSDVIVGPFEWTPEVVGHECILASVSADGDLSNIDPTTTSPAEAGPSPHSRLVPFDNNIAQRNLAPVAGGGGLALAASFADRRFTARNPFDRTVRMELRPTLPDLLVRRGWKLSFMNPGGAKFTLGSRAERVIVLNLVPGQDFSAADVPAGGASIDIEAFADDLLVGGMSFVIDPRMREPATELPEKGSGPDCTDTAGHLLDCLCLPGGKVKSVRVKRVTIDIDLADDC